MNNLILEPLYPSVEIFPWEEELFNTKYLKRLKHLSHFGAGAFVSPVVHSRLEHTIGVWKLAAIFFKDNILLRAAAILHDIGHLPFSHALEQSLGFNHHELTEEYINDEIIHTILNKIDLSPRDVINFLNEPNQLTGSSEVIGLDHLDSFLRDTYMSGKISILPRNLLKSINCNEIGVEADFETCMYLLDLIYEDHKLFLSPKLLAADRILAEAIKLHFKNASRYNITFLTDSTLLNILQHSENIRVQKMIDLLLFNPNDITINTKNFSGEGIIFGIRKIYDKMPLYNGVPISHFNEAERLFKKLNALKRNYELILP